LKGNLDLLRQAAKSSTASGASSTGGTAMKMESKKRAIDKIYKRRDRYEIPEWQRQEVWAPSKKQMLIDTILRGWKLPKFYFFKVSNDPESYEVVDGQQRLVTIWDFFDNEMELAEGSATRFGGRKYDELPDSVAEAFDDYEIEFDEIEEADEEDVKEYFQRLQEGLPLTSAEKLNSVHSNLRNFLFKLTKHTFFEKVAVSDRRHGHFDILAKVAAIEVDGIDVGLRYDDLRTVFESQSKFAATSNVAKRIGAALDFMDPATDGDLGRLLRNRTIVQSFVTLTCSFIGSGELQGREVRVRQFATKFLQELNRQVELGQKTTDPKYLDFQRTISANVKGGARVRQQVLLQNLLVGDPGFAEILDPSVVAQGGLRGAIASSAGEIAQLIGRLNEDYSAKRGKDLFKATNKTTQAMTTLQKVVADYQGYGALIDALYFILREGVGDRLDGNTPHSLADVNALRTNLRHDVDHGREQKVRAKRKALAKVFQKYAGAPSPMGLAPERFIVVQANLLSAIEQDLRQLKI